MSSLSVWAHFPTKSNMSQYSCTLAGSDDEYQKYTQLNISRFGDYLHRIYPNELEVNDTTDNQTSASYLDLHLEIDNGGRFKTKLYDKRDDFTFPIVNFPFISNNIPASPAFGVYISQLIRYSRACAQYIDFLDRAQLLTQMLLKQGCVAPRLKSSQQQILRSSSQSGWLLRNIHISNDNGSFSLYEDVSFFLSLPRLLPNLTVYSLVR